MRPDPGPDGGSRPDAPVSAAAVLEVAAGLRELDPQLSAELARHAARLAGTDGELRDAAERVAARSFVEGRRGVEVVERAVPALRAALRRGSRDDEVAARCDLALAALRCRASALATAVIAPLEPEDEVPAASWALAALRVAQVRAAEGDVEGTDRAVTRARRGRPEVGGPGDTLFEVDLEQARGEARRRRGDAVACAAVLGDLRARVADTADLDGGRRGASLVADHVAALVEGGALDDARARAASWISTPPTPATALGLGRLRVVVAGRLHLPAAPADAESLAWDAERDLADGGHHHDAAEAARVGAEAAELRGRWPEALAALRRARAHDARAREEERSVDRLLAGVLGYGEGLAPARDDAGTGGRDEAPAGGAGTWERVAAPPVLVPEVTPPPALGASAVGAAATVADIDDGAEREVPARRRRRRPDDDAAPTLPARRRAASGAVAPSGREPLPAEDGTPGGRRRRREADEAPVEQEERVAGRRSRPRHGRPDPRAAGTGGTDPAGSGPDGTRAPAEVTPLTDGRAVTADPVVERVGHDELDGAAGARDDFSTAPEPGGSAAAEWRAEGAGEDRPAPVTSDAAGTAGPGRRPAAETEYGDPLGVGWLLAPDAADPAPSPGPATGARAGMAQDGMSQDGVSQDGPAPTAETPLGGRTTTSAGGPSVGSGVGTHGVDELPLTLVGLLAEYDLPDVGRPGPPSGPAERPGAARGVDPVAPGPAVAGTARQERAVGRVGGESGGESGGAATDADGGARLADLLADAMDAFRRSAPETGSSVGRGASRSRPRS